MYHQSRWIFHLSNQSFCDSIKIHVPVWIRHQKSDHISSMQEKYIFNVIHVLKKVWIHFVMQVFYKKMLKWKIFQNTIFLLQTSENWNAYINLPIPGNPLWLCLSEKWEGQNLGFFSWFLDLERYKFKEKTTEQNQLKISYFYST